MCLSKVFKCVFCSELSVQTDPPIELSDEQRQPAVIRYEPTSNVHPPPVTPTHADPLSKF